MALPTDLSTLDYICDGLPHCWVPSKTDTETFPMDFTIDGLPFVGNQEIVAPLDANTGTLDEVFQGLPFAHLAADRTLDLVYEGLPFTGGTDDRNRTLVMLTNSITVTAGPVGIDGWNRKHPNPRTEMVYSQQEPSHVFPYIGIQVL